MVDLVGTCPKNFWEEWIVEGDPADSPYSGEEWGWYTQHSRARQIKPGDRFYVVAWDRLRGYAPVTAVKVLSFHPDHRPDQLGGAGSYVDIGSLSHWTSADWGRWTEGQYCICRRGGAVACTIDNPIPGFRGLEKRWWNYEDERPFPDWQTAGVGAEKAKSQKQTRPLPLFG